MPRTCCLEQAATDNRKMVSTRGFEPPTPGFIPLRLSQPSRRHRTGRSWSGLSLHHEPSGF
ncbi:hypothetical protein FLX27_09715 [Agrobacterium tumefaciens]|nr:hypothetical protein FLX27_09715 [Agrobacterium tumefaciens]